MKGWNIFAHSVGMVTRNLSEALKIALVPVLIGSALLAALLLMTGLSLNGGGAPQTTLDGNMGSVIFLFIMVAILMVTIELWIFVSWHRFILLEEYPSGWVPEFRFDRIKAYFGSSLLIGLVIVFSMLPIASVVGFIATSIFSGSSFAVILVPLVTMVLGYVIFYRLSSKLPAAAIGTPLTLGEAWAATKGATGTLLVTGLSTAVVQFLLQYVAGLSLAVFQPLGIAFQIFSAVVMSLVNVSILTTIYGHYVEGREIS